MKRYAYTLLYMAAFASTAMAQTENTLRVVEGEASRVGDDVIVDMKLDLSNIEVGRNRTVVYRPLLMQGDSVAELPAIIVNGRVRHIQYQRLERAEDFPSEVEVRRMNGEEQTLEYHARVPYNNWMSKSEIVMVSDLCGCGWQSLQNDRSSLFPVNLMREPIVPAVLYITPEAEVKMRSKSGSAYLDFPVNQTTIRQDYRRNSTELAAIDATIQSVEDDPNATITKVTIKGYASPEGSYANNKRLAEGRSNALLDYVKGLHDFGNAEFAVSDAPMQYALLNSQTKPDQTYYRPDQLDAAVAALDGDRTKMAGPTLNGDEYTMARIADVRMLPDTLGAQHILLQKGQNALADSLVNVLRGGADFAALAAQYSLDQYSEGGDLGRFTPAQLPMAFTDAAMNANVGDIYTVESDAGLQVVKLTYKTRPVRKMQVATVTYKIDPSAATIQEAYQKASNFVTAAAGTAEGFAQAVGDQMLSKRTVRIRTTDRAINGLENSKEIVRWAFNGKTGDVSQIMDIDGNYYVAALTGVREKGYATVEQATADITKTLMNQEKARILAAEMTGATLEEVAAATGEQIRKAENVEWNAFYIPEIGVEPQLVGAITAVNVGELSQPVEGVNGVYRFVVTDAQQTGVATEESEKVRLETDAVNFVLQRTMQALNEESDITDLRVKFF